MDLSGDNQLKQIKSFLERYMLISVVVDLRFHTEKCIYDMEREVKLSRKEKGTMESHRVRKGESQGYDGDYCIKCSYKI